MKLERIERKVIPMKGRELIDRLTPEYAKQREEVGGDMHDYEKKHHISDDAVDAAIREGAGQHEYRSRFANLGRRLEHYIEIHHLLLDPDHLGDLRGKTIVHVGAGNGLYARYLKDQGANAIALDTDLKAVRIAKRIGADVVRATADARGKGLPFADRSVNAFVSDHFMFSGESGLEGDALERGGSWALLKEMGRTLKPGGVVVMDNISTIPQEFPAEKLKTMGFKLAHGETRKHSWENKMVLKRV